MNNIVLIELDKPRTLKYGIKAIKQIEKLYKCNLSKALEKLTDLSGDDIVKLIYLGLVWEDNTLTYDKVEDLLDEYTTIGEAVKKLTEALTASFGTGDEKKDLVIAEI